MDLRLEVADGCKMPIGSFLAVKLGDALKQGRYEPSRSYQFPNVDKKRHAKIDLFKHVGSAAVLVSPEAGPHVSEVAVTSSCPLVEDLRLKVNMIPMGGKDSEPPKNAIRVKAQSYLEKHGIEEKLSKCMKLLLQQRPNNPIDFICCNLRGDDETLRPPVSCCDVETQTDAVKLESQSEEAGNLVDILQQDVPQDQDLRKNVRSLLTEANADGSLLQLMQQSTQDSNDDELEALRLETQNAFSSALDDGYLMQVLAENRGPDKFQQPGMEAPAVATRTMPIPADQSHTQSCTETPTIEQQQQHLESQLEIERLSAQLMMETREIDERLSAQLMMETREIMIETHALVAETNALNVMAACEGCEAIESTNALIAEQHHRDFQLEIERLNAQLLMETHEIMIETNIALLPETKIPKALIAGDETVQSIGSEIVAPATEVTAKPADVEYSRLAVVPEGRAEPGISSQRETTAVDIGQHSPAKRQSMTEEEKAATSIQATFRGNRDRNSMKSNAHSCLPVPAETVSRKSWASKPSVATWMKRRNWVRKPSVGTGLQRAPEGTESEPEGI